MSLPLYGYVGFNSTDMQELKKAIDDAVENNNRFFTYDKGKVIIYWLDHNKETMWGYLNDVSIASLQL